MNVGPRLPKCVLDAKEEGKLVVTVNGPATLDAFGPGEENHKRLVRLVRKRLAALDPGAVIVPVRQGFPLLVATIAAKMAIPLVFVDLVLTKRGKVERKGTNLRAWAPENRQRFKSLVRKASATIKFSGNSYEFNAYLVDAADALLCAHAADLEEFMLDHLVAYGDQMGKEVHNLLLQWDILESARKRAEVPVRIVSADAKLPSGALVVEIDSGALANPFGAEGARKYEEFLQKRLADKTSDLRKTLLNAWRTARDGGQVLLVTADPQEAVHGRILMSFLRSHLAPRSS